MRKILILGFAPILAVLTLGLSTGSANAAATDTVLLTSTLGSGHTYEGSFDACTGAIIASGTTTGATGTYDETVTGTYNKATGSLTLTSVYGMDANGHVDDSVTLNSAYAYTMTGTVIDNVFSGTYVITKTPVDGATVTRARHVQRHPLPGHRQRRHLHPAARPRRWQPRRVRLRRCSRWPQGQGLAGIAKDNTKVGAYGSATCPPSPIHRTTAAPPAHAAGGVRLFQSPRQRDRTGRFR